MMYLYGQPFFAIIGYIKNSKELENRNAVQEDLKEILDDVNCIYAEDIASKFIITLGDEFQGLLCTGQNVIKIIETIKERIYPVELRFGIGVGEITTNINSEMAIGADGPAYYNARFAIERLKENEQKNKCALADIRIELKYSKIEKQSILINTIFELTKAIELNWTKRQREIIWNMLKYEEGQNAVARRLGISQASVSKTLIAGQYYAYTNALKTIETELGEMRYDK